MKKVLTTFKTVLLSLVFTTVAYAADPSAEFPDSVNVADAHAETPSIDSTTVDSAAIDSVQKLSPFDHLGHNMLLSAFGWPLGFHMLGGALTYKFSMENNDLMVARFAARQDQLVYGIAFTPGMMMGTFFPILVPGYMYFFSDNRALNNTGAVAVQATAVAFLYNNFLKAISAREHPDGSLHRLVHRQHVLQGKSRRKADSAQGHHRPAILRRHQRRRAQRENLSFHYASRAY